MNDPKTAVAYESLSLIDSRKAMDGEPMRDLG